MKVTVELGRAFAREAGFTSRDVELPPVASAKQLLSALALAAPGLSCLDPTGGAVDLGAANLSVNGRAVDPGHPERTLLEEGDSCYLYGVLSGG